MKNININRTDLVCESLDASNYLLEGSNNDVSTYKMIIDEKMSKDINKPIGKYYTVMLKEYNDVVKEEISKRIIEIISDFNMNKSDLILIVGLGNVNISADALGPKTLEKLFVTSHIYNELDGNKYQNLAIFTPGVTGETGIETFEKIEAIANKIKPKLIICIDALCAKSIERVNKTVQITDTGITPGSGVGNNRKKLDYSTLNIPVVAIGVPTVVDLVTISVNTLNYLLKYLTYHTNKEPSKDNLYASGSDYLKYDKVITNEEKKLFFGEIGVLNEDEKREILNDALTPEGLNYIVSTKEIDEVIENLSSLLANSLNYAFHQNL